MIIMFYLIYGMLALTLILICIIMVYYTMKSLMVSSLTGIGDVSLVNAWHYGYDIRIIEIVKAIIDIRQIVKIIYYHHLR